ncbi:Stimulator of interferon genes [Paramuricea clavata]|uniref:Stimulator of interferon genes n=1 Tax=Paramuricea clavata TaxID=317549 RepID=A0A7D9IPX8_PARCT|nr:Stimulator of interferon genes [Paramuricea clavata]
MRENMSVVDVVESDSEQNDGQNTVIPVPEKRKKRARCVSIILCTITAILLIAFCVVNRNVVEYYRGPTQKNTTNVCYRKEEKLTFSGLFTTALGLFGVVLGTLVDRLSLIAEERHHLHQRYGGSRKKMIKACFSGILWGPVIALLGLAAIILVILIFVTAESACMGPLVMHLLSLNTQSEVHISTILEEKETYVANGLAWSYYFNYLANAVPKFEEKVPNNSCNSVQLNDGQVVQLNSNKLILLISHDCTTDDLAKLDDKISKRGTFSNGKYTFPVYCLTYNNNHDYCTYVIKYVKQPLETLKNMSRYKIIKALDEKQLEYQVKLLCRTLSQILKDPFNNKCKDKCILVAMKANSTKNLNNGELVNVIMQEVQADESTFEHVDGFIQVPSHQKPKQPKTIEDDTREDTPRKKPKTSDDIELQPMKNPAENIESPHTDQRKPSKLCEQEIGDGNDSGASTSGNSPDLVYIANGSRQSEQQDDQTNTL